MTGEATSKETIGAPFLPDLVGRTQEMDQIKGALANLSPQPCVVFISGEGGIGKTRVLLEALKVAQEYSPIVVRKPIDLYHTHTHTAEGLVAAIYKELPGTSGSFTEYERERGAVGRLQLSGQPLRELETRRQNMLRLFVQELNSLSRKQRVVLALDTAERLLYGPQEFSLGAEPESEPQAWLWLKKTLPTLGRVIVLIAGRPKSEVLRQQLSTLKGLEVVPITLRGLSPDASVTYFDHAARVYRQYDQHRAAHFIEKLPEDIRRRAHPYTDGRPILLALLVDYFGSAGRIPDDLQEPPADMTLDQIREKLEKELVVRLTEVKNGNVIRFLGYLPKGADADLLSKVMQIPLQEARRQLDDVRTSSLSFIKVRHQDQRVFLHDEMYALLTKHELVKVPGIDPEPEMVARGILAYYHEQLARLSDEFARLYDPIELQGGMVRDLEKSMEVHEQRRTLLTEVVYYRLQQNPLKGFQRWYRYNREATLTGDVLLDAQLETEVRAFLAERDSEGRLQRINGLERKQIESVLAMRPVVRAWAAENYVEVLRQAERLRKERPDLWSDDKGLTEAILNTWEAAALVYRGEEGDLAQAHNRLDQVIGRLMQPDAISESLLEAGTAWRARAVLAIAYRVRGYLNRVQGVMEAAAEDYRKALRLWRQINLQIELAETLNNMGFALAESGEFKEGNDLVRDALGLRRRLGPRGPVALSLNTLAIIHIRSGDYGTAYQYSLRALRLFRALRHRRGEGLALVALAEATRRKSDAPDMLNPDTRVQLLREASGYGQEAVAVFAELQERSRQVEALIELGCAYRDWVKVRQAYPDLADDIDRRASDAARKLRDATGLAIVLYQRVDALVNLAWLGFFRNEPGLIEEAQHEVERIVPNDYYLDPNTGRPAIARELAQVSVWPQLGKLYTLLGHYAFQRYQLSRKTQELEEAGRQYTLGLAYNKQYGENFVAMYRAKDEIYDRAKGLNEEELRALAAGVVAIERNFHLGQSTMRKFLSNRVLWYGEDE